MGVLKRYKAGEMKENYNSAKYFAIKKEFKRGSQKRGSSQGCQVEVAGSGLLSPYHRGPIGVQRTVADAGPPLPPYF